MLKKELLKNQKQFGRTLAVILFLIVNLVLYLLGKIFLVFPFLLSNDYTIVITSTLLPIIVLPLTLFFCKILKEDISIIGISKKNFMKSFIVGVVISIVLLILFGINNRYNNPYIFILRVFYYLVCVSLVEEIVFRGFIRQNISDNKKHAYILSGILFSISHIPFHMVINHYDLLWFLLNRCYALVIYVLIHLVLQMIYDKYQNCTGPVIIHFVLDFFGMLAK